MPSEFALPLTIALAVVVTVMILLALLAWRLRRQRKYQPAPALLTPAENDAYARLQSAVGRDVLVFARARATDVLAPAPGLWRGRRRRVMEDLIGEYLDFVICAPKDTRPLLVVAVADSRLSHRRQRRRARWLERLCADAGLPVLQLDEDEFAGIDASALRAKIAELANARSTKASTRTGQAAATASAAAGSARDSSASEPPTPKPSASNPPASAPPASQPSPSDAPTPQPSAPESAAGESAAGKSGAEEPVTPRPEPADAEDHDPATRHRDMTSDGRREPLVDLPDDFYEDEPAGKPQR